MSNLRLLINCCPSDGLSSHGHFAVVELTHDDLLRIAKRRRSIVDIKENDKDIIELRFKSDDVTFYGSPLFLSMRVGNEVTQIDADDLLSTSGNTYLVLSREHELDTTAEKVSETVSDYLCLDAQGVYWEGVSEDDPTTYVTETVTYQELFEGRL